MSENNIVNPNAELQEPVADTVATVEETATATTNAPVAAPVETAHDDFDWSIDKRNVASYNKDEKEKYDKCMKTRFVQINDGELIKGTVVGLTKTDVVLNIGFKSDGLVSLNEFRDLQKPGVGDEVEVMVVEKEDRDGHLNLSRNRPALPRAWERIVEVHKTGEVITVSLQVKQKVV